MGSGHALRGGDAEKAYKLLAEGATLAAALLAATKDLETRQFHFTERLLVTRKAPKDLAAGIANAFKDMAKHK